MRLADDAEIVGMTILPLGLVPEGSIDEDEEEEGSGSGAAFSSGSASPAEEEEDEGAAAAAAEAAEAGPCLLLVTAQGLGKRTPISEFRVRGRTGKGFRGMLLNKGDRLAAVQVVGFDPAAPAAGAATSSSDDEDRSSAGSGSGSSRSGSGKAKEPDVLLSTQQGLLVRVPLSSISVYSRTAKGRRTIKLNEGDEVIAATVLSKQR